MRLRLPHEIASSSLAVAAEEREEISVSSANWAVDLGGSRCAGMRPAPRQLCFRLVCLADLARPLVCCQIGAVGGHSMRLSGFAIVSPQGVYRYVGLSPAKGPMRKGQGRHRHSSQPARSPRKCEEPKGRAPGGAERDASPSALLSSTAGTLSRDNVPGELF